MKILEQFQKNHRAIFIFIAVIVFSAIVAFSLLVASSLQSRTTKIAIIGTNDIHGAAFPTELVRADTGQKYQYGGLTYMGRLIEIIQNKYKGNVLYMDGGDQFQGGIESSSLISSGTIMTDFYKAMSLDASAIGNHQFDFGPTFLLPYLDQKQSSSLAANLRSENGSQQFLPSQQNSKIFSLKNGVKIGVIGLVTIETPSTTDGFVKNKFPSYKFLQYRDVVLTESIRLKNQGSDIVLIISHVGNSCPLQYTYGIWKQVNQNCQNDEITMLIDSLPQNTIDGIIQGHRHKNVHNFYKGIPYMGVINGGYYFNVMYLTLDQNNKIIDKTIEGPIPVCEKVFKNIKRCNYLTKEQLKTSGELVSWKFHNEEIYPQKDVQEIFQQKWNDKMSPYLQQITTNQVLLVRSRQQPNELGNLITTIMYNAIPEGDIVLLNPGGFRTQWLPGILQFQHFFNMFPFDNILITCQITGEQLMNSLKILQSGQKGFYHSYGLQQNVTLSKSTNEKKFLSAELTNNTAINLTQIYTLITIDFLLHGGDDFQNVINKTYTPRNIVEKGQFRTVIKPFLKKYGTIKENTLIDPLNPRLIVFSVP